MLLLLSFSIPILISNVIAEEQGSGNFSASSQLNNDKNSNVLKDILNNTITPHPKNTSLNNDNETRSSDADCDEELIYYIGPSNEPGTRRKQRFKRNIRYVHRSAQTDRNKHSSRRRRLHNKERTASLPTLTKNRRQYSRYSADYGFTPNRSHKQKARYLSARKARKLRERQSSDFLEKYQKYRRNPGKGTITEYIKKHKIRNISKRKHRNQNQHSNKPEKTSKQKINEAKKKNVRNTSNPQISDESHKSSTLVKKTDENSKVNHAQTLKDNHTAKYALKNPTRKQKKENRITKNFNSKLAQNDDHTSLKVNVTEDFNRSRKGKEEKELITVIGKLETSSGTRITVQGKRRRDENVIINPKQNNTEIIKTTEENNKRNYSKDTSNGKRTVKSKGKASKRKDDHNAKTSKNKNDKRRGVQKDNHAFLEVNVTETYIKSGNGEVEKQLRNITRKQETSNGTRTKPRNKGKDYENVTVKLKQNNTEIIKTTKKANKRQSSRDTNKNRTTKNKYKASKRKNIHSPKGRKNINNERRNADILTRVNVKKDLSRLTERKEEEELGSAVNQTINFLNETETANGTKITIENRSDNKRNVKPKQNDKKITNKTKGDNSSTKTRKQSKNTRADSSNNRGAQNENSKAQNKGKKNEKVTVKHKQNNTEIIKTTKKSNKRKSSKDTNESRTTKNKNKASDRKNIHTPKGRKHINNKRRNAQNDVDILTRVNVKKDLSRLTERKEEEELRSATNQTIDFSNGTKPAIENRSDNKRYVVKPKQNNNKITSKTKGDNSNNKTPDQRKNTNADSSSNKGSQKENSISTRTNVKKYLSRSREKVKENERKSSIKNLSERSKVNTQSKREKEKAAVIHKQNDGKVVKQIKENGNKTPKRNKSAKPILHSAQEKSKQRKDFKKKSSKATNNKTGDNGQKKKINNQYSNSMNTIAAKTTFDKSNTTIAHKLNSTNSSDRSIVNKNNQTNLVSKNVTSFNVSRTLNRNLSNNNNSNAAKRNMNEENLIQNEKEHTSNLTLCKEPVLKIQTQHKQIQDRTSKGSNDDLNRHNSNINRDINHARQLKARNRKALQKKGYWKSKGLYQQRKYTDSYKQNQKRLDKGYVFQGKPTKANEILDDRIFKFPSRIELSGEKYLNIYGDKFRKPNKVILNVAANGIHENTSHKKLSKNGTITISRRFHNESVSHSTFNDIKNVTAGKLHDKSKKHLMHQGLSNLQYQKPAVIKFENVTEYNTTDVSHTQSINNGKLQGFNEKIMKTVHKSYTLTEISSTDDILADDLQDLVDPKLLE